MTPSHLAANDRLSRECNFYNLPGVQVENARACKEYSILQIPHFLGVLQNTAPFSIRKSLSRRTIVDKPADWVRVVRPPGTVFAIREFKPPDRSARITGRETKKATMKNASSTNVFDGSSWKWIMVNPARVPGLTLLRAKLSAVEHFATKDRQKKRKNIGNQK